jgi:hypothetical protein
MRSNSAQKVVLFENSSVGCVAGPHVAPLELAGNRHPIPLSQTRGRGAVIKLGDVVMILDPPAAPGRRRYFGKPFCGRCPTRGRNRQILSMRDGPRNGRDWFPFVPSRPIRA